MIKRKIVSVFVVIILALATTTPLSPTEASSPYQSFLSQRYMSLNKRHNMPFVNDVVKYNILLNLTYMWGKVEDPKKISWEVIGKPFQFDMILEPQDTFAYHDDVLPEYREKLALTGKAHFQKKEGFKSDGYLVGDGVCHLASLINWAARDAGLDVYVPKNHNFADIPEIPKTYGVSIFFHPGRTNSNAMRNLYVTNNKDFGVKMRFEYDGDILRVSIFKNSQVADFASRT